jgi:hypothetical protein
VEEEDMSGDPKEAFRAHIRVVAKLIKDKVANVFHNALHLLTSVVQKYGPELQPRDIQQVVRSPSDVIQSFRSSNPETSNR